MKKVLAGLCLGSGLLFVILKLAGKLAWSWWWVLSPLLGMFVFGLFMFVVTVLVLIWINKLKL